MFKQYTTLRAPEDDGEGAGGVADFDQQHSDLPIDGDGAPDGNDDGGDDDDSPPAKPDKSKKTPVSDDQVRAIAEAVAKGLSAGGKKPAAPAAPAAPQYTQEQIDKMLNKFSVAEDHLKQLGFDEVTPQQVKAFQAILDGNNRHATTMAQVMINAAIKQVEEKLGPISSFVQQQQTRNVRDEFFRQHKHLEKYEPIVKSVALQLSDTDENGDPLSQKDLFKMAAEQTEKILKDAGIDFSADGDDNDDIDGDDANLSAPQKPVGRKVPAMSGMAGGGRSSTGGKSGNKNNPDADIWSGFQ